MIELVGLAYDQKLANQVWTEMTVQDVYHFILEDEFRRKVDLRSLLYHKGHLDLITQLDEMLQRGAGGFSMVEFLAARFSAGIDSFPGGKDELAFDFLLIRHFASLAMIDDFLIADIFLRKLLSKVGYVPPYPDWSILDIQDYDRVATLLREVRMQDILELTREFPESKEISFEHLVRNYIEFLHYTKNNHLRPFFYNSESDFRKWGDLAERKNKRSESIVDLALRFTRRKKTKPSLSAKTSMKEKSVEFRMKLQRERDGLISGLSDSDPVIRQKAAESLGLLADESILSSLESALINDEPEVRQELVRAIAAISGERSENILNNVLQTDESPMVAMVAAHSLNKKKSERGMLTILDKVEMGQAHFASLLPMNPDFLVHDIIGKKLEVLAKNENPEVRKNVAYLCGYRRDKRLLLHHFLSDPDPATQRTALYASWNAGLEQLDQEAKKFESHSDPTCKEAGTIVRQWLSQPALQN